MTPHNGLQSHHASIYLLPISIFERSRLIIFTYPLTSHPRTSFPLQLICKVCPWCTSSILILHSLGGSGDPYLLAFLLYIYDSLRFMTYHSSRPVLFIPMLCMFLDLESPIDCIRLGELVQSYRTRISMRNQIAGSYMIPPVLHKYFESPAHVVATFRTTLTNAMTIKTGKNSKASNIFQLNRPFTSLRTAHIYSFPVAL